MNRLNTIFPNGEYKRWLKNIVIEVINNNKDKDIMTFANSFRKKCLEMVPDAAMKTMINKEHNKFNNTFKDNNKLKSFIQKINQFSKTRK